MPISAINTVEIEAAPGRVGETCTKLAHIVRALRADTECIGYEVTDNRIIKNTWLVSGYWASEHQMHAHFNHPELAAFMEMLNSGLVRRVSFNCFVVEQR